MSDKHSSRTQRVGIACAEGNGAEAQQKLYEQIIAHSNEAILILDPQGFILEQNPAHRTLTGYSDEELRGRRPAQLLGEGAFSQIMQELSRTGSCQTEASVRTRAGVLVTVDLSLVTVRDDAGKVLCHVALKRDITERKRAEEAIRESQDRFRQLAEHIQEVFYISDPELTQIIFISPAYEKVWGRTRKSLYENPRSFLDAIHPDDRERATAAAEKQEPAEYRILQPDGSLRWIWDRAFPVRDEKGRIYRFVGIAEDITDRKQAEEALRRSETRLSEAQRVGHLGSWEWDIAKNEIALSDVLTKIHGRSWMLSILMTASARLPPQRNRSPQSIASFNPTGPCAGSGTVHSPFGTRRGASTALSESQKTSQTASRRRKHCAGAKPASPRHSESAIWEAGNGISPRMKSR